MAASAVPAWLQACGLPQAWQGQRQWRVLDTCFGDGQQFLALWQLWAQDPAAPHRLHVVALADTVPARSELRHTLLQDHPALAGYADELTVQWTGLLPGMHRLVLHGGRLNLDLCIGAPQQALRELQAVVDTILIGTPVNATTRDSSDNSAGWDSWGAKALARICRLDTRLSLRGVPPAVPAPDALMQAGFTPPVAWIDPATRQGVAGPDSNLQISTFQPRWRIKHTRKERLPPPPTVSQCVVVGAGLAGAAAAEALARRGWQVTVLDRAAQPAGGASALPAGLLLPHVSRDDSPRSRLSRAGVRLSLQAARRLLVADTDYAICGVAELAIDRARVLPDHWPAAGREWTDTTLPPTVATHLLRCHAPLDKALWHVMAGWVRPAQLVRALLAHKGIRFQGNAAVHAMACTNGQWQLYTADGDLLAQAPQLVLANAGDAPRLVELAARQVAGLQGIRPLTALRGQVSWAHHNPQDIDLLPPFPVNGAGSVMAQIPIADGKAWIAGATYETASVPPAAAAQAHVHNRGQMARLLSAAMPHLMPAFEQDAVNVWQGTRWSSSDRLPLVGPLHGGDQPGVWLSTAMGSRGLTLAVLCAEVLAAQLCQEPAPLPARLLRLLAADRLP